MSGLPGSILLATDGSEDANLAARAAVDLSRRGAAELHVVHVWHDVPTPHLRSFVRAELRREAQELLEDQVKRIENAGGAVAKAHLREGRTVDEILDLSEELGAGLLVLGSRGRGGVKRVLLGSVSEGAVHHARCPVLVMRGGQDAWPPARMVVGDDSSEDAREAGELAASIGRLFGAEVILVRFYPRRLESAERAKEPEHRELGEALRRIEADLEDRAKGLEATLGSRPRVAIRAADDPAAAILEASQEGRGPCLIAVGARGLGPTKRIRLGGVTTKVVRAAAGPVLVYARPSRNAPG